MRTDELIVQLARAAAPIQPLAKPLVRLARWMAATLPTAGLGIILIGPRADVLTAIDQPAYVGRAAVTLVTALLSAASAFVLSVPGAERTAVHRVVPLVAGSAWTLVLVILLRTGGDPGRRLLALPFNWTCLIELVGLGIVPGWVLFAMLRRAAPLRRAWSAALATLAAVAVGAFATQFLCPVDDPAHQLVGHALPVALIALGGAIAGRRSLEWLGRV